LSSYLLTKTYKTIILPVDLYGTLKPEWMRPLIRPRNRLEDNIKMDLREVRFGDVDQIHLAQNRDQWLALENMVMNLQVP
jgi:hypothetical protein